MNLSVTDKKARMLYGGIIGIILITAGLVTSTEVVTGVGLFIIVLSLMY